MRYMLLIVLTLFLSLPSALAQESSSRFEVKTDLKFSENPPIEGSKAVYTVHISWTGTDEDGVRLIPPSFDSKGLKIENTGVSTESVPGDGGTVKQIRSFVFDLILTRKGEAVIESFPVQYMEPGRSGMNQIEVPGRSFQVKGLPVVIPWTGIGIGTGAVLVTGFLIYLIIVLRKRRKQLNKETDPAEEVLKQMKILDPLLKKEEYKEYIIRLTRELSVYLKNAHGMQSTDPGEVEKNKNFTNEEKKLLKKAIEELTELKYSKDRLNYTEVNEVKRMVEQFVESKRILQ